MLTAFLLGVTRIGNSVNGNPTWVLTTSIGNVQTTPDAMVGHEVANWSGDPSNDWVRSELQFFFDCDGHVYDIRHLP
jgi:hypothetical protein